MSHLICLCESPVQVTPPACCKKSRENPDPAVCAACCCKREGQVTKQRNMEGGVEQK
jgi:hypothetical protein